MKHLTLQQKIFLPIASSVTVLVFGFSWLFVAWQQEQAENSYQEQLVNLSVSSTMMIHSAAEQFAGSKGLRYQRTKVTEIGGGNRIESEALKTFMNDPNLQSIVRRQEHDGEQWMYVFAPARVQRECSDCHSFYSVDDFKGQKEGEVIAVFGIAGSMEGLFQRESKTRLMTLLFGIATLVALALIIRPSLNRTILHPLRDLAMQSELVAQGDLRFVETPALDGRMNVGDEMGQLARSYGRMLGGLRTLIQQVGESSSAVASSSTEISSTTQQLAAGAQEQTSQAGEVASAVEQMTKSIVENSQNAQQAAEVATKQREIAEQGGMIVQKTVTEIKQVAEVVKRSAETVEALGRSSDRIGAVVKVIDEIAGQTNLLALNAAIEAARAGDEGRGFAVVADEVRKLADRTTKATGEIGQMIHSIQEETTTAVSVMQQGTEKVDLGLALADKAEAALAEIVHISQKVTEMVMQIAVASEEQSATSEQISKNVEAISTVTHQSAAGTQQIAQAAEDLNRLTENLQQLVAKFMLLENSTTKAIPDMASEKKSKTREGTTSTLTVREHGVLIDEHS